MYFRHCPVLITILKCCEVFLMLGIVLLAFCRIRAEELQQFLVIEQKVGLVETVCQKSFLWVHKARHLISHSVKLCYQSVKRLLYSAGCEQWIRGARVNEARGTQSQHVVCMLQGWYFNFSIKIVICVKTDIWGRLVEMVSEDMTCPKRMSRFGTNEERT